MQGDWRQAEQWINAEMDRRMEAVRKRLTETEAHFSATNQRLEDEAKLAGAIDGERFARTQEDVAKVSDRLAELEAQKGAENERALAMASTVIQAAEEAKNARLGLREATQVLGDLGAAVQEQQSANESVRAWIDGMEKRRARETASMEGALAEITRTIEALDKRVAEATSNLVARSPTSSATAGDGSPLPTGSVEAESASGSDAGA